MYVYIYINYCMYIYIRKNIKDRGMMSCNVLNGLLSVPSKGPVALPSTWASIFNKGGYQLVCARLCGGGRGQGSTRL